MISITYNTSSKNFEGRCNFGEQAPLKAAGLSWQPTRKIWATNKPSKIASLNQYFDCTVAPAIQRMDQERADAVCASASTDSTLTTPAPDGQAYLAYQQAGIAYALTRKNVLIGDEMGLGKTVQAIGVWNATPDMRTVLIVCPASLRTNWLREWQKWDVRGTDVLQLVKNTEGMVDAKVVITSYDGVKKHLGEIVSKGFDMLILDESHYIKNPKSARTQAIQALHKSIAKKTIWLSGTPMLNRPIELWPMLQMAQPGGLGRSWVHFVERYCDAHRTKYGWDTSGSSHRAELQTELRASMMIRRLKNDVLCELPDKRRQIIMLPADKKIIKAEQDAMDSVRTGVGSRVRSYRGVPLLANIPFEQIAKIRHATALAKVPEVIEHLRGVLEEVDKVVVFAHHLDVIQLLRTAFGDEAVVLAGDMDTQDRQDAVDRFQTDLRVKIFIGSLRAAGVGITLTASSVVVFAESDWTPGAMDQAEDRCHRIGQKNAVLVQHIIAEGTIDALLQSVTSDKREIIAEILQ